MWALFVCGPLLGLRISPSVPHYGGRLPSGQSAYSSGLLFVVPVGDIVYILGLCPKGFKPSNSLFKGAIRAYGLSIATEAFPARQLRPGI